LQRRTVYLLMALVVFAEAVLLWLVVSRTDIFFHFSQIAFYAPAVAFMIVCFLPKIRMGIAPGTPGQVLSTMSFNFRIAQYRVIDKGQSFVVQGGTDHGIRVFLKAIGSDSVVLIRSDPTPAGWGLLLILLIFTYGFGTIPLSLYLFIKSQKFGLSAIPAMYKRPGETIAQGTPSKTRACLIDTLSEGYRLSSEAYESAKSNYEDRIVLCAFGGLAAWLVVFVTAAVVMGGDFDSGTQILTSAGLGLVAGIGLPLVSYVLLRARSKAELLSLREWATRMREELASEVSYAGPSDRQKSTFEVILDASREIPGWLRIRRKSGLHRHPVVWMAILFLVLFGSEYLMAATFSTWEGFYFRAILGAVSVGLIILGIGLFFYWRRKETDEARHVTETWKRRADAIQRKMDEMLRDL